MGEFGANMKAIRPGVGPFLASPFGSTKVKATSCQQYKFHSLLWCVTILDFLNELAQAMCL